MEDSQNVANAGTLVDVFETGAAAFADRIAFESFGARLSYSSIADHARAIASGLQRLGLQKGDCVAIMAPNVMACAPVLFGVIAGGFVLAPINPDASPQDLAAQLNASGARVIFVLETSAHILCDAVENLETLERAIIMAPGDLIGWRGFFANVTVRRLRRRVKPYTLFATLPFGSFAEWGAGEAPKPVDHTPDDVAMWRYAGAGRGSVRLAHRALLAEIAQAGSGLHEPGVGELATTSPALAHDQPVSNPVALILCWLSMWRIGAKQILLMDARDPGDAIKAFRKSPPDMLALSPALYGALAGGKALAGVDLSRLKACASLSAGMTADIAERWKAATGVDIAPVDSGAKGLPD